jgi:murein DD-endopeptidase MepM/ murein hydrolase activator NlpD
MLLATSQPPSLEQSQNISLPGQVSNSIATDAEVKTQSINLALAKPVLQTNITPSIQHISVEDVLSDETIIESAEIEQLHLDTLPVETITNSDGNEERKTLTSLKWETLTVQSGDNLSKLFPKVGLTARDVYLVMQAGDIAKPLLNLKPGQTLRFGLDDSSESLRLSTLELVYNPVETLRLTSVNDTYEAETVVKKLDTRRQQLTGYIDSSLFEAGMTAGMSDKLIMELAYIFGWDIDFALDLRQGDHFKVIYEESYLDGNKYEDGAILAAEFTNAGSTFKAIRFTDSEGKTNYFTPEGDSMRKAFLRTPVDFTRISSKFNPNRKHPILNTTRPHRGVDYAAPTGTPIKTAGDGKVVFAGTKGGYGKTVIVQHGERYSTLYAHLSRIKPGMKTGKRVSQGQTIGYVGSTGYATGPHLHYEFRVNGVHMNPLTVKLPHAEPLSAKYMDAFKQQSQPLLAQLDGLVPALAANQ